MNALRTSLLSLALLAGTLPSSGCGLLLDAACDAAFTTREEKHVEVVECPRCHHRHSGGCASDDDDGRPRSVTTVTTTTTRTTTYVENR
jgi:hypothetical protein